MPSLGTILLSLLVAFIPALGYTLLVWWLDRYEREPFRLLVVAFFWGAVPAIALAVLPVPLKDPDPDVPLELGPALAVIYDEAVYELSIDYSQKPPPPALSEEEAEWLAQIVNSELS